MLDLMVVFKEAMLKMLQQAIMKDVSSTNLKYIAQSMFNNHNGINRKSIVKKNQCLETKQHTPR